MANWYRNTFSILILFISEISNGQEVTYFSDIAVGPTFFNLEKNIPFSNGLTITGIDKGASVYLGLGAEYKPENSKWIPGFRSGFYILSYFDLTIYGDAVGKKSGYVSFSPGSNYGSRYGYYLKYFYLEPNVKYQLLSRRKYNLYGSLGFTLMKFQKSAFSYSKIISALSSLPSEESKFYYGFNNLACLNFGFTIEFLRKRLELGIEFSKSFNSLYTNGNISSLGVLGGLVRYKFHTTYLKKFTTESDFPEAKLGRDSDKWLFGARIAYRLGGQISTHGSITTYSWSTNTPLVQQGPVYYDNDFFLMPMVYASRGINSRLRMEGELGYRSLYFSQERTKDPDITGDHGIEQYYQMFFTLGINPVFTVYKYNQHQLQLNGGISLWKGFCTECLLESTNNLQMGMGYQVGPINARFQFYTNLTKMKKNAQVAKSIELDRLIYTELSLGYSIFSLGKNAKK